MSRIAAALLCCVGGKNVRTHSLDGCALAGAAAGLELLETFRLLCELWRHERAPDGEPMRGELTY